MQYLRISLLLLNLFWLMVVALLLWNIWHIKQNDQIKPLVNQNHLSADSSPPPKTDSPALKIIHAEPEKPKLAEQTKKTEDPAVLNELLMNSRPAVYDWTELPTYYELPQDTLKQLPKMDFSAHLYLPNDSSARMILVNGVSLAEGDMISDNLRLEQITPEGVVLLFKNTFKNTFKNNTSKETAFYLQVWE